MAEDIRYGRVLHSLSAPNDDSLLKEIRYLEKRISAYLPSNYEVMAIENPVDYDGYVYFKGHDNAGWTIEDYVIPRLGSGLMFAEACDKPRVAG